MKNSETCPVTEVCRWFECNYRVYVEDRDLYRKLIRRKGCIPHGIYYFPNGSIAWDVIVPDDQIDSVRRLLKSGACQTAGALQPRMAKSVTKRGLNDNKIQRPESTLDVHKSV